MPVQSWPRPVSAEALRRSASWPRQCAGADTDSCASPAERRTHASASALHSRLHDHTVLMLGVGRNACPRSAVRSILGGTGYHRRTVAANRTLYRSSLLLHSNYCACGSADPTRTSSGLRRHRSTGHGLSCTVYALNCTNRRALLFPSSIKVGISQCRIGSSSPFDSLTRTTAKMEMPSYVQITETVRHDVYPAVRHDQSRSRALLIKLPDRSTGRSPGIC
jgi:hypothetical protein